MASAEKLLEKHNYKEISVLDIVADSKVNRNTFYYHFKDLPALVEAVACRAVDGVFADRSITVAEKLKKLARCMYENKKTVLHVYSYADRIIFDKGFDNVCGYLTERVFDCCTELQQYSEEERLKRYKFCKCCFYGLACDWMVDGLSEDGLKTILNLCEDSAKFFN